MKTHLALWSGWAGLALILGCFSDYPGGGSERAKPGSGTADAVSSAAKTAPSSPAAAPTPSAAQPGPTSPVPGQAGQTPGSTPSGTSPWVTTQPIAAPAQAVAISLSAGVALPQPTVEGTVMGFSVDYQFIQGQPQPSESFFWVIERSQGAPIKGQVKLKPKDTLYRLISAWRPEQGPFRTYIEDSSGRRVSETVDLRGP